MRAQVLAFGHAVLLHEQECREEDRLEVYDNAEQQERIRVEFRRSAKGIPGDPSAKQDDMDCDEGGRSTETSDRVGNAIGEGSAVLEVLFHLTNRLDIPADRAMSGFRC